MNAISMIQKLLLVEKGKLYISPRISLLYLGFNFIAYTSYMYDSLLVNLNIHQATAINQTMNKQRASLILIEY